MNHVAKKKNVVEFLFLIFQIRLFFIFCSLFDLPFIASFIEFDLLHFHTQFKEVTRIQNEHPHILLFYILVFTLVCGFFYIIIH